VKPDPRLVDAFYEAALWQIDQLKHHGWKKFTANFLREYARGKTAIPFSNDLSPVIMDEVIRQHPHLARYIKLHKHAKGGRQPGAAIASPYDLDLLDDDSTEH
jgi:hypothetical protein